MLGTRILHGTTFGTQNVHQSRWVKTLWSDTTSVTSTINNQQSTINNQQSTIYVSRFSFSFFRLTDCWHPFEFTGRLEKAARELVELFSPTMWKINSALPFLLSRCSGVSFRKVAGSRRSSVQRSLFLVEATSRSIASERN